MGDVSTKEVIALPSSSNPNSWLNIYPLPAAIGKFLMPLSSHAVLVKDP